MYTLLNKSDELVLLYIPSVDGDIEQVTLYPKHSINVEVITNQMRALIDPYKNILEINRKEFNNAG